MQAVARVEPRHDRVGDPGDLGRVRRRHIRRRHHHRPPPDDEPRRARHRGDAILEDRVAVAPGDVGDDAQAACRGGRARAPAGRARSRPSPARRPGGPRALRAPSRCAGPGSAARCGRATGRDGRGPPAGAGNGTAAACAPANGSWVRTCDEPPADAAPPPPEPAHAQTSSASATRAAARTSGSGQTADRQALARLDAQGLRDGRDAIGAAAVYRRIAASSVAPIRPGTTAPCVLALLGSQPPRTSRDLPISHLRAPATHPPWGSGSRRAGGGRRPGGPPRRAATSGGSSCAQISVA